MTVDVEPDAYDRARELLGTRGYSDTINAALREVSRIDALRRGAERIRNGGLGVVTPGELGDLRKRR